MPVLNGWTIIIYIYIFFFSKAGELDWRAESLFEKLLDIDIESNWEIFSEEAVKLESRTIWGLNRG